MIQGLIIIVVGVLVFSLLAVYSSLAISSKEDRLQEKMYEKIPSHDSEKGKAKR